MAARESLVGIGRILFTSLSTLLVPQRGPSISPFPSDLWDFSLGLMLCCNATEVVEFLSWQWNSIKNVLSKFCDNGMKTLPFYHLRGSRPLSRLKCCTAKAGLARSIFGRNTFADGVKQRGNSVRCLA